MIVGNFDAMSVHVFPDETDAPLSTDADALLSGTVPSNRLRVVRWRYSQVVQASRGIDAVETHLRTALDLGRDAFRESSGGDPLGHFATE
jgi:hypothetical protein